MVKLIPGDGAVADSYEKPMDAAVPTGGSSADDGIDGSNGHDREAWLYPASNADGQGLLYQFRGVPQLGYYINKLVYGRRFPYRDKSDLFRHALHRHVIWLQNHPGCPRAPGTIQLAMMRILEEECYEQQFGEVFEKTDRLVGKALGEGNPAAAERLVRQLWNAIRQLETGPWRDKYLADFKNKYGRYLK